VQTQENQSYSLSNVLRDLVLGCKSVTLQEGNQMLDFESDCSICNHQNRLVAGEVSPDDVCRDSGRIKSVDQKPARKGRKAHVSPTDNLWMLHLLRHSAVFVMDYTLKLIEKEVALFQRQKLSKEAAQDLAVDIGYLCRILDNNFAPEMLWRWHFGIKQASQLLRYLHHYRDAFYSSGLRFCSNVMADLESPRLSSALFFQVSYIYFS
jgi:hypothetical protein